MNMTRYLEVTGALRGGRGEQWFRLPDAGLAARSVRFGRHALVLDDTMRILPLGDTRRVERASGRRPRRNRVAALLANSKLLSFLF